MANLRKFIYIHVACLEGWEQVYDDIISFIPIEERKNIISVVLGDPGNHKLFNPTLVRDIGTDYDEVITLQMMWNHAKYLKEEAHFYYVHLKGISRRGVIRECCDAWRQFSCYQLFRDINLNERLLNKYDCLGSLMLTNPLHYQGNFFVCRASHLRKLPYIEYRSENRYHESWITCVQGKYVDYIGNYKLINLYENKIHPSNYVVSPWYVEQVKLPHGTTHLPITARCDI